MSFFTPNLTKPKAQINPGESCYRCFLISRVNSLFFKKKKHKSTATKPLAWLKLTSQRFSTQHQAHLLS
jgi:hypothetical protein